MIMCRKPDWSVERTWAETPTTIQRGICKEKKRFSRMVRRSSAVGLLLTLPAKQKVHTKGAVLGVPNKYTVSFKFNFRFVWEL